MTQAGTQPFQGLGENYMLSDHAGDAELQMEEYRSLAERIASDKRHRVLDWGCGFGHLAEAIRQQGLDVTLYDYVPDVPAKIGVPLQRYPDLVATVSSDEIKLPFEDSSFDSVVSMGTLEHVQYPNESLQEIRRVLRPGGYLYVYKLPNRWSYVEYLAKKTGRYYHGALPHDRVYTLTTAEELLTANGFAVVEAQYMNMLPLMSLSRRAPNRYLESLGRLNQRLSRVPAIRLAATNVQVVAIRTDN